MTSIGSPSPFFLAGKKAYEVERSLRFNRDDNAYLNRTPSSSSISTKATLSFWFKPSTLISGTNGGNFFAKGNTSYVQYFNESFYIGNSSYWMNTAALLRDFSAWYHAVVVIDTTQATATDRQKVYLNNVLQARGSTVSDPAQNANYEFLNDTSEYFIGKRSTGQVYHGYMAEINFIDGLAYDPSYFGETDSITGKWNPKKYTGSYGTNGFYLNFSDNSSTSALGTDSSGNGNNWTPNNFSVSAGQGNDSLEDTPTNNFCTMNPLFMNATEVAGTMSDGNLTWKADNNYCTGQATFSIKTGKWYWEAEIFSDNVNIGGITRGTNPEENTFIGYDTNGNLFGFGYYFISGTVKGNGSDGTTSNQNLATSQTTFANGDICGFASDIPNGTLAFYKNGTLVYTITGINSSFDWMPSFSAYGTSAGFYLNFGQRAFAHTPPTGFKALCSANLDDPTIKLPNKHFDTFLYNATGNAMSFPNELNFQPDWIWQKSRNSTVSSNVHYAIDAVRGGDKGLVINSTNAEYSGAAITFTSNGYDMGASSGGQGNASGNSYVSWNWNAGNTDSKTYTVKVVSDSGNKYRFDDFGTSAVTLDLAEGGTYIFDQSDSSNATHPLRFYTAADKTGGEYTTGVTTAGTPGQAGAYTQIVVAASAPTLYYQCSAHANMGGQVNTNSTLGSSNFDGTIQSVVKASPTAGFSITAYSGNGSNAQTVGHGLGVAPDAIILKARGASQNWRVWHRSLAADGSKRLLLDSTNASENAGFLNDTAPTSSLFTLGNSDDAWNASGGTYITYLFSEVAGYSKFGSYKGNGSTNGTFVFTNFRPAVIILKRTNSAASWVIHDDKRAGYNGDNDYLHPDNNQSESDGSTGTLDILSNGFKLRMTAGTHNGSGDTYIYFAFAESPFKNARAR